MKRVTTFFSVFVACLLVFTALEAQEITDDLVLGFSFEEGAGNKVEDRSLNGNNGTIEGNPNWVDGKLGKALQFDGKTFVVAPHIPLDDRDFTVQLWVNSEMATDPEGIFSQHDTNSDNLSLHLRVYDDGRVRMGYYGNDLDAPAASMSANQWHNLTFTFDAADNTRTIYVDGEVVGTDVSGSAYLGAKGDTTIGIWARPSKPPLYHIFHGIIDEVRVWHRVLDADDMASSMDTTMSVEPQGKIATMWGAIKHSN